MKHMKRIVSIVLALTMVLAMGIGAFAAETYKISVDTTEDPNTHTYKIYQIFTGTPVEGEANKLENLQYGSSYPGGLTGPVPEEVLSSISDARAWAADNQANLGPEVATLNGTTTSYDAVPGWYLVLDTNYTGDEKDAYSAFMMKVVDEATTFKPKKEVPSSDKQVADNDDGVTSGDNNGFGETADHEIGKSFQFKLTATFPAGDYSAYDTYKVVFKDTMSTGITFEKIDSIKIGGQDATGTLAGVKAGDKGEKSWTITFDNVTQIAGKELTEDLVIEVIYSAHLNEEAKVNDASGTTTNNNKFNIEYSNNPDATGDGDTDETPEDYVWVFTYGKNGNKVDANEEPVEGAEFQLYAINAAEAATVGESKDAPAGSPLKLYKKGNEYFVKIDDGATGYEEVTKIVTTSEGTFAIKGLDCGTYALHESKVPEGYVQATNSVFTISATHQEAADGASATTTLTQESTAVAKIVNLTGSTLPETGGIGTTIFYVVGAMLAIGAAVVLVTKKRVNG